MSRVWSGNPVAPGSHRAVALVLANRTGERVDVCSGTLVAPRYVLTAAHCIGDIPGQPLDVALGGTDVAKPFDEVYSAGGHAVHPDWAANPQRFDIALIELPTESKIAPMTLAGASEDGLRAPGAKVTLAGWGSIDGSGRGTGILRDGLTNVRPWRDCSAAYANFAPESMVCADGKTIDSCRGDSGGPLLARAARGPVVVGVTSFGAACDVAAVGAYTWVGATRQWIDDTIASGISPFTTRAVLRTSETSVPRGRAVAFTAKLLRRTDDLALGRQQVDLQHRGAGSSEWQTVERAATGPDGTVKLSHTPTRDSEYRLRHAATAATKAGFSSVVTVKVKVAR